MAELRSPPYGLCHRCQELVQAHEDSTYLEEVIIGLRDGRMGMCGFTVARHIRCSPSRVAMLSGAGPESERARQALALLERAAGECQPEKEHYNDTLRRLVVPQKEEKTHGE